MSKGNRRYHEKMVVTEALYEEMPYPQFMQFCDEYELWGKYYHKFIGPSDCDVETHIQSFEEFYNSNTNSSQDIPRYDWDWWY